MPYVGNQPAANFASVTKDAFSGDGTTDEFTLSKAATTNGVAVFVENVRQEPTTAYSVSGTTLTFTAAPVSSSGNNIYVLHHNAPASTATHPAGQDLTAVNGTFTSGLTVASNVDITNGDIIFGTSGNGINLGVTSNTDSNTLDDYEEGTWTPTTGNSGGGFQNIISATYTKIGRLVNVSVYAVFDSSQPNSNQVRIGGLPFASISTIYHYAVGRLQGFADKDISWQVGGTSDYFTPYYNNSIPTYNQVAGNYVIIAGSYITNS